MVFERGVGIDFKTLMYFVSAAETLNFSKTAQTFNVSQTAISLAILKLESEIGFPLFDRRNRPICLTEAGDFFYDRTKKLLKNYEFSVKRGQEINEGFSGTLKIVVPSMFEALVAMAPFRQHQKKRSGLDITLTRVPSPRVAEYIAQRRADASICCANLVEDDPAILSKSFMKFTYCIAMHANHPYASMQSNPPEKLDGMQCITLEDTSIASEQHMQDFCRRAHLNFKNKIRTNDIDDMLFQIGLTDNFGLVPTYFQPHFGNGIVCRPIATPDLPEYQLALCYRKDNKNSALQWLYFALLRA